MGLVITTFNGWLIISPSLLALILSTSLLYHIIYKLNYISPSFLVCEYLWIFSLSLAIWNFTIAQSEVLEMISLIAHIVCIVGEPK